MRASSKTTALRVTTTHLESLQAAFAAALIDARFAPAIAPVWSGGEHVAERLGIHRANLFSSWEKALGNAFPVIRAIVGAAFFRPLAREYGHTRLSTSTDLNRFGEKFPHFIRHHERAESLPYLGDVAELEWLVHRAYFAADMAPLQPALMTALSPSDLLANRFSVDPACGWLSSKYPIASIWAAHQPHATVGPPITLDQNEHALVYRANWRAQVSISNSSELAALTQLRARENMETAIRSALEIDPEYPTANALLRWLDFNLLGEA